MHSNNPTLELVASVSDYDLKRLAPEANPDDDITEQEATVIGMELARVAKAREAEFRLGFVPRVIYE